jgi:putative oxidoreductase
VWAAARDVSGFNEGAAPENTSQRLCPHSPVLSKERRLVSDEIDRDVGESDATGRHMTQNEATLQRGRASLIALWLTQVALAAMFLMAGGSKLAGVPAMVSLFDAIGVGQWFRYVTGVIEVTSGIALLVPAAAVFGAMLLIPTMLGAIVVNVFIARTSPVMPLLLLLAAAAVAWARRHQLEGVI